MALRWSVCPGNNNKAERGHLPSSIELFNYIGQFRRCDLFDIIVSTKKLEIEKKKCRSSECIPVMNQAANSWCLSLHFAPELRPCFTSRKFYKPQGLKVQRNTAFRCKVLGL